MNLIDKLILGSGAVFQLLLKRRHPFAVSWAITNNCNAHCLYCDSAISDQRELNTDEMLAVCKELQRAGTRVVSLTGGEPLMRHDFGNIVAELKKRRIYICLNTNGKFHERYKSAVLNCDMIRLSLDGREKENDDIRGSGAYENTITALTWLRSNKKKVALTCVLSSLNCYEETIKHVLSVAERFCAHIYFQPATQEKIGSACANEIVPTEHQLKCIISFLIQMKKSNNKSIGNSMQSLRTFLRWPQYFPSKCFGGYLCARIEADGYLYSCGGIPCPERKYGRNIIGKNIYIEFKLLKKYPCGGCWCAVWQLTNWKNIL